MHLDSWSQIPALNHMREALPFREAYAEAVRSLSVGDDKTDIARLYPQGTDGWLQPGREVCSIRLLSGRVIPKINWRSHVDGR